MFLISYLQPSESFLQGPINWIFKSLLLLVAVYIVERQVRSAALAHRIWLIAMFGFLLIPFVSYSLPSLMIEFPLNVSSPKRSVMGQTAEQTTVAAPSDTASSELMTLSPSSGAAPASEGPVVEALPMPTDSSQIHSSAPVFTATAGSLPERSTGTSNSARWLLWVWASGTVLFLFRVAFALYVLNRLASRSRFVDDGLQGEVHAMSRQMGVTSGVRLCAGSEHSVPMVWWWGGWNLMLPSDFHGWPKERRRIVIAHELGHVARRDAFSDLAVQILCSFGWFHPFVWLAASKVQQLREDACDDVVLRHFEPDLYATQLLAVVSECLSFRSPLGCPVVRQGNLERRVRMILAGGSSDAFPTKWKAIAIVMIGFLLTVGISLTSLVAKATAETNEGERLSSATKKGKQEELTEYANFITSSGVVTDRNGVPLAGVHLQLRANLNGTIHAGTLDTADLLAEVNSKNDGTFRFDRIGIPLKYKDVVSGLSRFNPKSLQILAKHADFGLAWHSLSTLDESGIQLQLPSQAAIRGKIVDVAGEPIVDAVIRVTAIFPRDDSMRTIPDGKTSVDLFFSSINPRTKTDGDGRFEIGGLPNGQRISFAVNHPEHPTQTGFAAVGENLEPQRFDSVAGKQIEHVNPISVTLKSGPKVHVSLPRKLGNEDWHVSVTGKQSYYPGLAAKGRIFRATATEPGEWYVRVQNSRVSFGRPITLEEKHMNVPLQLTMGLPDLRELRGIVSNREGQPVKQAMLSWTHKQDDSSKMFVAKAITDDRGQFSMTVLPGKGKLEFIGTSPSGFLISSRSVSRKEASQLGKEVVVPESGIIEPLKIEVPLGLVVSGRLLDIDEKSVANATVKIFSGGRYAPYEHSAKTDSEGNYRFVGLHPRQVYFLYSNTDAGIASATIPSAEDHPYDKDRDVSVDMTTEPRVALVGRVLKNGQPVAQVNLKLRRGLDLPDRDGTRYVEVDQATSDTDGNYRLWGLKRGDRYQVEINAPFRATAPGWRHQNPYVVSVPLSAKAEYTLDDIQLSSLGQTIAGRVVDPEGNPVPGASISAQLRDGRRISRRMDDSVPPPWTTSDERGRFRLTMLPDEPVSLMAYIPPKPPETRIRYPANVEPKYNQRDVRILLDPTLVSDE